MILDNFLSFSSAQDLAKAAADYDSSNIIDLGVTSGIPSSANGGGARDIGTGDDPSLKLLIQVTTAFTSGGAGTLAAALKGAADDGTGSPGAYTTMWTSPTFALATLTQGAYLANVDVPRVIAGQALPRFLKLTYTIGTATMTAGNVSSYIVIDRFDQVVGTTGAISGYRAGITVAN